jgi:RNA-binding protein
MASPLTNKERAHLKARAHALEPVVQTGNAGITDAVVAEVDRALTAHELLKVRIGTDDREERVALGETLSARTGATAVHRVGKVLILWRARPLEVETSPPPARPEPAPPARRGASPDRGTPPRARPRRRPS